MTGLLTDDQITRLLSEPKPLPVNFRTRLRTREKSGHSQRQRDLPIVGGAGSEFRLFIRESVIDPLEFTIGLTYRMPHSNIEFRLRRYDGKSHFHTNRLDGTPGFFDFHIHYATERYQAAGRPEDAYAVVTDAYSDAAGALAQMINDCGFVLPEETPKQQPNLF